MYIRYFAFKIQLSFIIPKTQFLGGTSTLFLFLSLNVFEPHVKGLGPDLPWNQLLLRANVRIICPLNIFVHLRDDQAPVLLKPVPVLLIQEKLFVYLFLVPNGLSGSTAICDAAIHAEYAKVPTTLERPSNRLGPSNLINKLVGED